MKKYISLLFIAFLLLCGCGNEKVTNDKELKELKESIESNSKLIEELTIKNKDLENKIVTLEEEKQLLNEEIKKLQESDKTITSNVDSKYNELKASINNKPSNTSNQYTITKGQLLGTWKYNDNSRITFTDENLKIYGNWFEWDGMSFSYIYKDGKLYVSDDGIVATKQK